MIITDQLIFLHFPKTGGIFVAEVLKKVHAQQKKFFLFPGQCKELKLPNLKRVHGEKVFNVHGTYEQIPKKYKGKQIISCIRNPFDLYVSTYEYRAWVNLPKTQPQLKEKVPNFPDVSFREFMQFFNHFNIQDRTHHELLKIDIGFMTYAFIQFFFKNPKETIANLDEAYLNSEEYKKDMPEILFLRNENLNHDLYQVLLKCGYPEKDISFIKDEKRINATPSRNGLKAWQTYYDQELYDEIKFKERFIFHLFPEYLSKEEEKCIHI